jgi:hypothetical protein
MIRAGCLTILAILLVASLIGIGWGIPLYAPVAILSLFIFGLLFERFVYQPLHRARPGAGWQATQERFVDPSSGKQVTVWFHAATGERRYVADVDPPVA